MERINVVKGFKDFVKWLQYHDLRTSLDTCLVHSNTVLNFNENCLVTHIPFA